MTNKRKAASVPAKVAPPAKQQKASTPTDQRQAKVAAKTTPAAEADSARRHPLTEAKLAARRKAEAAAAEAEEDRFHRRLGQDGLMWHHPKPPRFLQAPAMAAAAEAKAAATETAVEEPVAEPAPFDFGSLDAGSNAPAESTPAPAEASSAAPAEEFSNAAPAEESAPMSNEAAESEAAPPQPPTETVASIPAEAPAPTTDASPEPLPVETVPAEAPATTTDASPAPLPVDTVPADASPDANIFVKNLDQSIDSRALSDTFGWFGAMLSCKVSTAANGASRGYGFVQYESEDAAKQAIECVNGMLISGKKVWPIPHMHMQGGRECYREISHIRDHATVWKSELYIYR